MAVYVAQDGLAVATGLFLATFVVRMFSATASPARFSKSGKVALAKILPTLQFPGSAAFHRRVEDFRPHVAVYAMLHGYTFMHICGTDFTGALFVAPAHIPGSYRLVLTLYHAIRCMCSLRVYSGRSGALSPVPPWLPHIRRPCIALGGLSTDITYGRSPALYGSFIRA